MICVTIQSFTAVYTQYRPFGRLQVDAGHICLDELKLKIQKNPQWP